MSGDALSLGYRSELEDLQGKLERAKEGLRDCINLATWKRLEDASELIAYSIRS